jgi:hypothetical protein
MERMGTRSATELLRLPVRLNGIRLGRPVDVLLDSAEWRALGFVVLCGDESLRFLVFAAAVPQEDVLELASAFLLLEDLGFYREHSRSLRGLLGSPVLQGASELGELRDLLIRPDGCVGALVVEGDDGVRELAPAGLTVGAEHVPTA